MRHAIDTYLAAHQAALRNNNPEPSREAHALSHGLIPNTFRRRLAGGKSNTEAKQAQAHLTTEEQE